jgi:hypothetical protein
MAIESLVNRESSVDRFRVVVKALIVETEVMGMRHGFKSWYE